MRPYDALVAVGSNIEPERNVPRALESLRRRFTVVALSPCYRSAAEGGRGSGPSFVNLAVRLRTDCPPRALREVCRRLEEMHGRRRGADRNAPRTLDLDVVLVAGVSGDFGSWRLPDPDLATRAFVLVPAADAWPDALHPDLGRPLAALAAERARAPGDALARLSGEPWDGAVRGGAA